NGQNKVAQGNVSEQLAEDMANAFLKKAGADLALRGGKLFITRHRDLEEAEAQRSPSPQHLAQVCRSLTLADETPAKLEIARKLLPAVNAQLLEHLETSKPDGTLKDRITALVKS